jgi:hypothetical protein
MTCRTEGREINGPGRSVEDQLGHRFSRRGRVENAPDTMACCHVRTRSTRCGTDQRKSVLRHRAKARLACENARRRQYRRNSFAERFQPIDRAIVGNDAVRISR